MSKLEIALQQIKDARRYTCRLLDQVDPSDWFRQPMEGVTHVAWQVAHVAVAQYWLALNRVRGKRPGDDEIIPEFYLKRFGRESVPDPNPSRNPSAQEIRSVFDRVHEKVLSEIPTYAEAELEAPVSRPQPMYSTRIGALLFCPQHEMAHAGQIGLLRRLHGKPTLW